MQDYDRTIMALIIWWCEGTKARIDKRCKTGNTITSVEVINTDVRILKTFIDFLKEDLQVPIVKFHGQIQIHEGDDQFVIEKYWSEALGIPVSQFNKTIIRPKGNKEGKNKGTFKVRVYDKKLYEKLYNMLNEKLGV